MKHAIKISTVILASIFVVVACEKEQKAPVYNPGETITITATLPTVPPANPASKVDFTQGTDKIDLAWSDSDKLTIINEDTDEYSVFTLTSSDGVKANFTGTAISGTSFTVLYPGTVTSVSDMDDFSFVGQTQTGNANLAHLKTAWTAKITGLSDFSDVKFAAPAGGTFDQSGILKFYIQMPDYVTTVTNVSIEAGSDVFFTDNDDEQANILSLALSGITLDAKHAFTAYMAIPQKDSDPVSSGETVTVKIVDGDGLEWKKDITLTEDFYLQAGKVNVIQLAKSDWDTVGRYAGGTGVNGDPYLISAPIHMVHMNEDLTGGSTLYFKLIDDIDMTPVTGWSPANAASPYNRGIDFDGDGHTISNFSCGGVSYPSLFGVLYGTVKDLVVDNATITVGAETAGVIAGYIGTGSYNGSISGITVKNSTVKDGTKKRLGGIAGYAYIVAGTISDCHVINTTVSSKEERVGGMFGETAAGINISNCTAENVTVEGNIDIGGLAGVGYGNFINCSSSGSISSINTTSNKDIALGGLVGYFEGASSKISGCSSSVTIDQTTNGRDIGGLVGKMLAGTIEKSYATGDVKGIQRNVGGLVGLVTLSGDSANITDSYATGNVGANAYAGGLLGLQEKGTVNISNCYASGNVIGSGFALGGLVGVVGSAALTISDCAPASYGSANWSSGAVIGVTFPTCTLTDNYRNPSMSLTAYWVPAADYQHADVSPSHPLVKQDGTETTATSTASGQDGYPQFPYHGKVAAGKTLSELAATLGWDAAVWDLSGSVPTLK